MVKIFFCRVNIEESLFTEINKTIFQASMLIKIKSEEYTSNEFSCYSFVVKLTFSASLIFTSSTISTSSRSKSYSYSSLANAASICSLSDSFSLFARKIVTTPFSIKFVQSDKQKKGTSTVDYEFLTYFDTCRTYLANNIALRNDIAEDELNFVVQHTIDRLIFLRIAEDRSLESNGNLQDTVKNGDYYQNIEIVYEVYGLTKDEIALIENA